MITCICMSSNAFAGGYRVALQGENATGMGHTGVAVTESAEVVFFNPAGMSNLEHDTNIATGVSLIDSKIKYQNTSSNVAAETDNPIGTPFYLYASKKLNPKLSYGLGVYTPFGNTVEWERDWAGSHLLNNISLRTVYIQPTVAYQLNDKISFGVGPYLVNGSVEMNQNLSTSLVDSDGNRSNVTIKASNINAWGYNVGVLMKPVNAVSVGLSYRSRVDLDAKDEPATFSNIPVSLQSNYPDSTFDASLVLPAELTVGVAIKLGDKTVLALDVNRTFWSAYKSLEVTFHNDVGVKSSPRNYKDVNIYRAGIQHKAHHALTIRAGAYYDNSPISEGYYTPESPRNNSVGLTTGASYQVSKRVTLDFSFLYLMFEEFGGAYDHYDQSGTTTSFGGDYLSTVTSAGFGLNYKY